MSQSLHILILAAGQGKRMHSKLPKVLHPVLFQPMVHHVLDLAKSLPHSSISLIVGHGSSEVKKACGSYTGINYFEQKQQRGTADAVMAAKDFLFKKKGKVLILSGDVPLLRKSSLEAFLEEDSKQQAHLSLVTTFLEKPLGYGRILRNPSKKMTGIIEEADANPKQKKISEINAGIYCFEITELLLALSKISNKNKQGEFYLTDTIELLVKAKKKVLGIPFEDPIETMGINDRLALSIAEKVLQNRTNEALMLSGVRLMGPDSIWIDSKSQISPDCIIESNCLIRNSKISSHVHLKQGCYIEESEVGEGSNVGPYAHLRPGSKLGKNVKIGNFVEIKKSEFKDGSKASHLSYIGDAEIGEDSNLGCGFITCNYDGVNKHKTIIEENVFIGSDTQVIAPLTIGRGSYIASGSTVTQNVPEDSLVISRGKQVTKPGYARKYFKK